MKTMLSAAIAALLISGSLTNSAAAQASAAGSNAPKFGVAVVDVSYIFKNHASFRKQMDGMKGEMQQIEQSLEGERKKILAKEEEKNSYKPGSPEFKKADDDSATLKAQFQLNMQRLRKDFMEKEAKAYYATYKEVSQAISYYAKQKNIGLVLRFNGEPADPAQREAILRDINKPVQFQNQIDITPDVLAMVNRGQAAPTGSVPAVGNRPGGRRPQ